MTDPRAETMDEAGDDLEAYRLLLDLWTRENPIKTWKLQALLGTNALLVATASVMLGLRFGHDAFLPLCAGAAAVDVVWTLSLGRTALFQEAWQTKLREVAARHPGDERFAVHETRAARDRAPALLRVLGGMSTKWYLVLTPAVFAVAWAAAIVVGS